MLLSLAAESFGPAVIGAVLAAALLHATWNAIAHGIGGDRLAGFALMGFVDLAASAVLHTAYNLLLWQSYRLGEFSEAYPLTRGVGPLIVTVMSIFWLGRTMPPAQLVGVLLICAGLVAVVAIGGRPRRDQLPGLAAATATGIMIAGYTVVDASHYVHIGHPAGTVHSELQSRIPHRPGHHQAAGSSPGRCGPERTDGAPGTRIWVNRPQ